jgi:hypothetical protein
MRTNYPPFIYQKVFTLFYAKKLEHCTVPKEYMLLPTFKENTFLWRLFFRFCVFLNILTQLPFNIVSHLTYCLLDVQSRDV